MPGTKHPWKSLRDSHIPTATTAIVRLHSNVSTTTRTVTFLNGLTGSRCPKVGHGPDDTAGLTDRDSGGSSAARNCFAQEGSKKEGKSLMIPTTSVGA
jgi:hypothetical protein